MGLLVSYNSNKQKSTDLSCSSEKKNSHLKSQSSNQHSFSLCSDFKIFEACSLSLNNERVIYIFFYLKLKLIMP